MKRTVFSALLASAIGLSAFTAESLAGFTDALSPLHDAVHARQETVDGSTRKGHRAYRTLVAAEKRLAVDSRSVGDALRAVGRCAKRLARGFEDDPELAPLLDRALSELLVAARVDRDDLDSAAGTLDDPDDERRLDRAVSGFDDAVERAAIARHVWKSARRIRAGWKKVVKVAERLGVGRVPDFLLRDANPSSPFFARNVSPRDYVGKISAYYFGHAT